MGDDLVKRLRDHIAVSFDDRGHVFEDEVLCDDAADRIEELEEDNKRLRLEVLHANDTADTAINQVRILCRNIAKLIKASKPFAAIKIKDGMSQPGEIGRTDVTNIRAALAELKGQDDG